MGVSNPVPAYHRVQPRPLSNVPPPGWGYVSRFRNPGNTISFDGPHVPSGLMGGTYQTLSVTAVETRTWAKGDCVRGLWYADGTNTPGMLWTYIDFASVRGFTDAQRCAILGFVTADSSGSTDAITIEIPPQGWQPCSYDPTQYPTEISMFPLWQERNCPLKPEIETFTKKNITDAWAVKDYVYITTTPADYAGRLVVKVGGTYCPGVAIEASPSGQATVRVYHNYQKIWTRQGVNFLFRSLDKNNTLDYFIQNPQDYKGVVLPAAAVAANLYPIVVADPFDPASLPDVRTYNFLWTPIGRGGKTPDTTVENSAKDVLTANPVLWSAMQRCQRRDYWCAPVSWAATFTDWDTMRDVPICFRVEILMKQLDPEDFTGRTPAIPPNRLLGVFIVPLFFTNTDASADSSQLQSSPKAILLSRFSGGWPADFVTVDDDARLVFCPRFCYAADGNAQHRTHVGAWLSPCNTAREASRTVAPYPGRRVPTNLHRFNSYLQTEEYQNGGVYGELAASLAVLQQSDSKFDRRFFVLFAEQAGSYPPDPALSATIRPYSLRAGDTMPTTTGTINVLATETFSGSGWYQKWWYCSIDIPATVPQPTLWDCRLGVVEHTIPTWGGSSWSYPYQYVGSTAYNTAVYPKIEYDIMGQTLRTTDGTFFFDMDGYLGWPAQGERLLPPLTPVYSGGAVNFPGSATQGGVTWVQSNPSASVARLVFTCNYQVKAYGDPSAWVAVVPKILFLRKRDMRYGSDLDQMFFPGYVELKKRAAGSLYSATVLTTNFPRGYKYQLILPELGINTEIDAPAAALLPNGTYYW